MMKKIVSFYSILFFFTLGVTHAWALPPCPSDTNATFDNCFGTYDWTSGDNKGDKYTGEWKKDKMHGQGTYTFVDGDIYFGGYKDDKRHGQGAYIHADGDKYFGEYKDGKRNGQGTYTFADGSKDLGEWENDKLNGYAIQYNTDGSIIREGIFKDNEFVFAETREKKETSKLDKYKSTCEELGFVSGTEKFGDCVMKLMDKD